MIPAYRAYDGFLILTEAQINNLDLLCAIKTAYPHTKLYAPGALSREARAVMSIGNARQQPSGMVGYFGRQADITLREIRSAVDKIKSATR